MLYRIAHHHCQLRHYSHYDNVHNLYLTLNKLYRKPAYSSICYSYFLIRLLHNIIVAGYFEKRRFVLQYYFTMVIKEFLIITSFVAIKQSFSVHKVILRIQRIKVYIVLIQHNTSFMADIRANRKSTSLPSINFLENSLEACMYIKWNTTPTITLIFLGLILNLQAVKKKAPIEFKT